MKPTNDELAILRCLFNADNIRPGGNGWLTSRHCGGSTGSHHAPVLARLHCRGLVSRGPRGGHVYYRITKLGEDAMLDGIRERLQKRADRKKRRALIDAVGGRQG